MAAIATDLNGTYIFAALEDSSGHQAILRAEASDLSTWTAVYQPGAGSAANVIPAGEGYMLFYGNFGTDVGLIRHTISGGTNTDISPNSLGSKVVNCAAVNPHNENEIMITVGTDQDVLHSDDAGSTWTTLENALGFNATALAPIWDLYNRPHEVLVAGHNGANIDIRFTPNDFASSTNVEGSLSTSNITNIEVIPE